MFFVFVFLSLVGGAACLFVCFFFAFLRFAEEERKKVGKREREREREGEEGERIGRK